MKPNKFPNTFLISKVALTESNCELVVSPSDSTLDGEVSVTIDLTDTYRLEFIKQDVLSLRKSYSINISTAISGQGGLLAVNRVLADIELALHSRPIIPAVLWRLLISEGKVDESNAFDVLSGTLHPLDALGRQNWKDSI